MDDAEMYLFAEPNPLAGKLRADLIAMGLMPQTPRPMAHNVADDEPHPAIDGMESDDE